MNPYARTALPIFGLTVALSVAAMAVHTAAPSNLDLTLTHPTVDHRFVVTLQPPATPAAIGQMHAWQLRLATPAGAPVVHARIAVDGGMPQHGHGLPTRPQVTHEGPDGTYLIEGVKFSMTGWWELRLRIESGEGSDLAVFNTVVAEPASSR